MGTSTYDVSSISSKSSSTSTTQTSTSTPKPKVDNFVVNKLSVRQNIPREFRFRESTENDIVPEKTTIAIWIDSTGSMKEWPRYLLPMLEKLFYKLYNSKLAMGLPDIGFGSIGDVCDGTVSGENVIYQAQYETDEKLISVLKNLTIPGGGGPNTGESYDLALLASLMKTKMSCSLRGKKGLIILPLDEPNTDGPLSADNIRRFIDSDYQGSDLTLEQIIDQVRKKFVICVVVVETYSSKQLKVPSWWKEKLGEKYVYEIPQSLQTNSEKLARVFVDIVENCYPEMIANVHCTYQQLHDPNYQSILSTTSGVQNLSVESVTMQPRVRLSNDLIQKINQALATISNSTHDQAFYISTKRVGQQYLLNSLLTKEVDWSVFDLEALQHMLDDQYPDWCESSNGSSPIVQLFNEVCHFVSSTQGQEQTFDEVDNPDNLKTSGMSHW